MNKVNVKEILKEAKSILINKGWTTQVFARNEAGMPLHVTAEEACKFCMLGSIYRAVHTTGSEHSLLYLDVENALELVIVDKYSSMFGSCNTGAVVPIFNDHIGTTKEKVLEVFDAAIASCDSK